jgi:anthranilate phosphoribosyltransferase
MTASPFPDPCAVDSLTETQVASALENLLDERLSSPPKAEFLDSMHRRGETAEELASFSRHLLERAIRPAIQRGGDAPLLELCGTGGDRAGYLNISTAAMFVAAGAGARVLKHGNRAFSSKSGSADVLEALGVNLHLDPEMVGEVMDRAGCVFLLASDFHPAFAILGPLRREMAAQGKMTIFNLLGPLLNPGLPEVQLTGIYRSAMLPVYAKAMKLLGRRRAWAVHGESSNSDGVDEVSILGSTRVNEVSSNDPDRSLTITPEECGLPRATDDSSLIGGDASENAVRITAILEGREQGSATDMIVINAAAALHLAGIGTSLKESASLASESIRSGKALTALHRLREASAVANTRG